MERSATRRTRRSARRRGGAGDRLPPEIDGGPVIVTDGDRVLQIISNLLSNAFRWTPDGGHVELELSSGERHRLRGGRGHGPGIAADERERIFRPVLVGDGAGAPGSGSRSRVSSRWRSAARIELESEPGRGSRFELVLAKAQVAALRGSATPVGSAGRAL